MNVRAISADELTLFACIGEHPLGADGLANAIHKSWDDGECHPEWCFVVEQDGQLVGRLGYEGTVLTPHELTLIALWLPWDADYLNPGIPLIQESLRAMFAFGWSYIERRIHSNREHAQAEQILLLKSGIPLAQEKGAYTLKVTDLTPVPNRLIFRSTVEVGFDAIPNTIAQIMDGTLDRVDAIERDVMGNSAHANIYTTILKMIDDRPEWWHLAYTHSGDLVGVIIPQGFGAGIGCINFIGVVPGQRGHGYANDLLAKGTSILQAAGLTEIIADVDDQNIPMRTIFERAGYKRQSGTLSVFLGSIDKVLSWPSDSALELCSNSARPTAGLSDKLQC
jgi:ribosomal protein S18 acetylase RimI-like enzyme